MMSDQMFFGILILLWLAETGGLCWIIERKMNRIRSREKRARERRQAHDFDYYCSQEAERLYYRFYNKEGGIRNGQIQD